MYRLATMHVVTDRQTTLSRQQPIMRDSTIG